MIRNKGLDYLRLVLAFMVVGIHTNFLGEISPFAAYLMGGGLFRIAVPIFFLISGFYFRAVLAEGNVLVWIK